MACGGKSFSQFAEYDPLFGPPTATPPLVPGPHDEPVFEIGLVLNGAVSAGAYTGGVLDYLTEALDAFDTAKAKERDRLGPDAANYLLWTLPHHHVRIRVISGASAGGMSGAMLAAAHDRDFPHIHDDADAATHGACNPFYNPWVRRIDITGLLGTSDLAKDPATVHSLLDCTQLEEICSETLNFAELSGCGVRPGRSWLDAGLRLCFTITNLRGVPYEIAFPGGADVSFAMARHADCQRFVIAPVAGSAAAAGFRLRGDEIALPQPFAASDRGAIAMGNAALATASFPVALRSRLIEPVADFAKSWYVISDAPVIDAAINPTGTLAQPQAWTATISPPLSPDTYASGDGGMIDNAPVELARIELAGILGHNPRDALTANRALIMVNPFPEPPAVSTFEDPQEIGIFAMAARMLGVYTEQARFDPNDIRLAIDDAVYSRYMIHPRRTYGQAAPASGAKALACGAMGAFSGFLSEDYRRHDFLLGRMNCEGFLRKYFSLPVSVGLAQPALFAGQPSRLDCDFLDHDFECMRPIIPICGVAGTKHDRWPINRIQPINFNGAICTRVAAVLAALTAKLPGLPGALLRLGIVRAWLAKIAAQRAIDWIKAQLAAHALYGNAAEHEESGHGG